MTGRSLWSVLMLAWLGATNAAGPPPGDAALANRPVAGCERDGGGAALVEPACADDAALSAQHGDRSESG